MSAVPQSIADPVREPDSSSALSPALPVADGALAALPLWESRPAYDVHAVGWARLAQLTPAWRWIVFGLILVLSACLEFIGLDQEGYGNTYYAAGVKSMLTSWHNFFFVSFDSAGFVSIDKPPLGLWIEAVSAKVFGFSGISLLAPEAVAGVLSVALLYHLVARAHGALAGLLAAAMLAVTPISAIVDRNNTIDSLLILSLLLGVWAISLAAERASVRLLLLAALAIGLAFNIKMLQGYLVVPAFGLVYLLGARTSWRKRAAHLVLAGLVLLVVSFAWIAIVDSTPAGARPFVSDSGTNSELSLVLGYNGLGRFVQTLLPGLTHLSIFGDPIDLTIEPGMSPGIGNPGPFRLISAALGGQASWFLLPGLAGLLAIVRFRRPHLPLGRQGQSLLLWGGWLLVAGLFFSMARFFHFYYLVMIAPPIAALAGAGLVQLWHEYRRPMERPRANWRTWLLPATLLGTALLQVHFLNGYPDWSEWLAALIVACSLVAASLLVIARLGILERLRSASTQAFALGSLVLGIASLFPAPTTWAVASIAGGAGGAWLPQAGQAAGFGGPGGSRPGFRQGFGRGRPGGFAPGGFPGGPGGQSGGFGTAGGGFGGSAGGIGGPGARSGGNPGGGAFRGGPGPVGASGGVLTFAGGQVAPLDSGLLRYLEDHQGTARYLVATATSSYASLFILETGRPAMALGGYQGWDRILTLAQLKQQVAAGTVRFFYLSGSGSVRGSAGGIAAAGAGGATASSPTQLPGDQAAGQNLAGANDDLTGWVQSACAAVPSSRWQSGSSSTNSTASGGGPLQLYDCAGRG